VITKEQFERAYCERSHISLEQYHEWRVTLPCACDYEECEGWAAVSKDERAIADHMELYAPKEVS
jgi:hypothetical protein